MSDEMKSGQMKTCPQCDNHCPADALQCGKGRRFFGVEEGDHSHGESGSLTGLFHRCEHFVHHAGVEEGTLFQVLTEEEKTELQSLLEKLDAGWRAQFGEEVFSLSHHHGHSHGGEHHSKGRHDK